MDVKINTVIHMTPHILGFELVSEEQQNLPSFTAGAHIDVYLENGLIRQYSLANCSNEQHRYVIGVLKDENSRGGSQFIHDNFKVGQRLKISEPRNLFPLHPQTQKAVLFAGGIGITPILAMAHELKLKNIPFDLHYFSRSRTALAFTQELENQFANQVIFHVDEEPDSKADLTKILANPNPTDHLYICGPNGFMDFIIQSAQAHAWPNNQIHKEHFVAASIEASSDEFEIEIKSTGQRIPVRQDQTAAQALEEHGCYIPLSCEQGICGTCLVNVLEGEPDHRDMFMTEEEQALNNQFTPCCSRSKSKLLVLDL